jgi:hypothetical protein
LRPEQTKTDAIPGLRAMASIAAKKNAFSQKSFGSAAVLLRPITRRSFLPPLTLLLPEHVNRVKGDDAGVIWLGRDGNDIR